jgi:hypothetical protein
MPTFEDQRFTELVLKLYWEKLKDLRVKFMLLDKDAIQSLINIGLFRGANPAPSTTYWRTPRWTAAASRSSA